MNDPEAQLKSELHIARAVVKIKEAILEIGAALEYNKQISHHNQAFRHCQEERMWDATSSLQQADKDLKAPMMDGT